MKTTNYRRIIEGGIVRQVSDPYRGVYYAPLGVYMERDGLHLIIDPEAPHWLSTNEVGAQVLRLCDGRRNVTEVAEEIARRWNVPFEEAEADTFDLLSDAVQVLFVCR